MSAATLTEKGQIVIPAEIRARYELTPGTQLEFVDEGGVIRLIVRRRVGVSEPAAGYGMIKATRKPADSTLVDTIDLHRRDMIFADALRWSTGSACNQMLSFDDRRFVRPARKLELNPEVQAPR
jgi:antitoxin PrlF